MSYIPIEGLCIKYPVIQGLFTNTHKSTPFLVYGFFLNDDLKRGDFKVDQPGWLEVRDSGNTYQSIRVHFPRKRGSGFVQAGTITHATDLKLFKTREKAEEYIAGYLNNQKLEAQRVHDFFEAKIGTLIDLVLP